MNTDIYCEDFFLEYIAVKIKHHGFIDYSLENFIDSDKLEDIKQEPDAFLRSIMMDMISRKKIPRDNILRLQSQIPDCEKSFFLFALIYLSYFSIFRYSEIYREDDVYIQNNFEKYKDRYPYLYVLYTYRLHYNEDDALLKGDTKAFEIFFGELNNIQDEKFRHIIYAIVNAQLFQIDDRQYKISKEYLLSHAENNNIYNYILSFLSQALGDHDTCFTTFRKLMQAYPNSGEFKLIYARHLYLAYKKDSLGEVLKYIQKSYKDFNRVRDINGKKLYILFLGKAYLYCHPEKGVALLESLAGKSDFYKNICYIWISNYYYERGNISQSEKYSEKIDYDVFDIRPNHRLKLQK